MKLTRTRSLLVAALLLSSAGCALRPQTRPARWLPGTYEYQGTLPSSGGVWVLVDVSPAGFVSVSSSLGPCDVIYVEPGQIPAASVAAFVARGLVCGTEHRVGFRSPRGREGPPVEATITNERIVTETTYGETTCRECQTTDTGERVCIAWNVGPKTVKTTTGSTARLYLVPDTLATRP